MQNKKGLFFLRAGLLLIAAALCLVGYNLWEGYRVGQITADTVQQLHAYIEPETAPTDAIASPEDASLPAVTIPGYIRTPEMEMPTQNIDGWDYIGMVEIPALALELPVISHWSYPALKVSPCRYQGSAYTDDLILLAHNYQSHFGSIQQLQTGDVVSFTDMNGNVFAYEVVLKETLEPTAIEEMEAGEWDLTLFTCTVGGSYRVTVRCECIEKPSEI